MDYKQLKIMALALSLPGVIFLAGMAYQYNVEAKIIPEPLDLILFSGLLIFYIVLLVKIVLKNKVKSKNKDE